MRLSKKSFSGIDLQAAVKRGIDYFAPVYYIVNRINVFPIPDGDTGSNIFLTLQFAYQYLIECDSLGIGEMSIQFAKGALMGARGSSGTLLAQVIAGFSGTIADKVTLDQHDLVLALKHGVQRAYEATPTPIDGTLLSVTRILVNEAESVSQYTDDIGLILMKAWSKGKDALFDTPELLPVLKQAGVIDAGALGILLLLEGMLGISSKHSVLNNMSAMNEARTTPFVSFEKVSFPVKNILDVQFTLTGAVLDTAEIQRELSFMGDTVVVSGDTVIKRIHIHTDDPEKPIKYAMGIGTVSGVAIENMSDQATAILSVRRGKSPSKFAIVSFASTQELLNLYINTGSHYAVETPDSTRDLTLFIDSLLRLMEVNNIVFLPNDTQLKNQLIELLSSDSSTRVVQRVYVIPTQSPPEGIRVLFSHTQNDAIEEFLYNADRTINEMKIIEICQDIYSPNYAGKINGEPSEHNSDKLMLIESLIRRCCQQHEYELCTVYVGASILPQEINSLSIMFTEKFTGLDFEVIRSYQRDREYWVSLE